MPGPRPARIAWLSPVVAAAAAREPESCERKRPTLDDTHSMFELYWTRTELARVEKSQSGTSTSCWWQAIMRGILDFSCCRPAGSQHDRELADPERHEHTLGDKDGALKELKVEGVRQVLPKCTYLQDGMIFFMCFAFRMWFVAFNSPLIF